MVNICKLNSTSKSVAMLICNRKEILIECKSFNVDVAMTFTTSMTIKLLIIIMYM